MLVVEQNGLPIPWGIGSEIHPLEYGGDIVIAFDPSKTNMAMVIGTPTGTVLNILEFSGNNRKRGPAMDTTQYCAEVRSFLAEYLKSANIYLVGVEQAVMYKGMQHYHSQMVLTEIRGNLLNFFREQLLITVIEVNNYSWKSAILPQGYRGQHQKGSKKYFEDYLPDSPYTRYFEADVTDCLCIYQYLCSTRCNSYSLYCNRIEQSLTGYSYSFVPVDSTVGAELQDVVFNKMFSLDDNLAYYTNRLLGSFCMQVDMSVINISDIYGKSLCFSESNLQDSKVKVVAVRK